MGDYLANARYGAWINRWIDDDQDEDSGQSVSLGDALALVLDDERSSVARPQMPYTEYLKTPHWQKIRRRALLRSGGICRGCHRGTWHLEVHHLTYARCGAERDGDVLALCPACHAREHQAADND